jgi:uncharacterized membrane protein
MLELFLALAWYQMMGMIAFPVIFFILVFNDELTRSLIFLTLSVGSLHYFAFIDLKSLDLVVCFYSVIIYLILGCAWSLFKYKQKAEEIAKSCRRYPNNTKEDVIKSIKNNISNSQIVNWIVFFPVSIIKFFLSDFVDYLISKLGRVHEYIARSVVDSVFKDSASK